jgi:hypothetical protein
MHHPTHPGMQVCLRRWPTHKGFPDDHPIPAGADVAGRAHLAEDMVLFVGSHGDLLGSVAVCSPFFVSLRKLS